MNYLICTHSGTNSIIKVFSTTRMIVERLQIAHFAELNIMHQNSTVMATLGGVRSPEQTRQFLNENLEHWQRYGFGLWIFQDKITGKFIGRGGIRRTRVAGHEVVELAYALMPEFWGQGLATEAGKAIVKIAFKKLDIPELACFTMTTNLASQQVMQKLGFKYERDIMHASLPHVLYRLPGSARL